MRIPAAASARPTAPPISASVRLSESSSQVMRRQLAPSAAWMASSCCRPSARTRNRFATLAQAMSRTMPTVPSRTQSTWPTSPMTSAASGRTLGPILTSSNISRLKPGGSRNRSTSVGIIRADIGVGLFDGDARLQPRDALVAEVADEHLGAVEAERHHQLRVLAEEAKAAGQHADDLVRRFRRRRSGGRRRADPIRTCAASTRGSASRGRGALWTSSSLEKRRPTTGCTRRTPSVPSVTSSAWTRSGSPAPVTDTAVLSHSPMSSNVVPRSR